MIQSVLKRVKEVEKTDLTKKLGKLKRKKPRVLIVADEKKETVHHGMEELIYTSGNSGNDTRFGSP